ncbi:HAD family hydrolase [Clostridium sp. Marseille-P299]|uniref:HAD family hydrolase n=1 Tax=Clostridium sp. Marseille-P299 TaxID=1805477 RepID=UPI00082CEFAF|nr:HAD family hydrolase [Clostridium sp. Marseille-P299]
MKYVFMDLDGTITNPKEGITKSIQYSLDFLGIKVDNLDTLTIHIGPPLVDTFKEYYGFDEEKTKEAVKKYKERYIEVGWCENIVYEGMEDTLKSLTEAGKKLIVATSKPESMAKKILDHYNLSQYFTDICGSADNGDRAKKHEVIQYAMDKNAITDRDEIIMVGDRSYDILGAKKLGIKSIGVLYGFGNLKEFEDAGANYIAKTVSEMRDICFAL